MKLAGLLFLLLRDGFCARVLRTNGQAAREEKCQDANRQRPVIRVFHMLLA
jgi:hypothetical protein